MLDPDHIPDVLIRYPATRRILSMYRFIKSLKYGASIDDLCYCSSSVSRRTITRDLALLADMDFIYRFENKWLACDEKIT